MEASKQEKCMQCGWPKNAHANGYCYHYSDEDTDYFYNDRKFISKKELLGKKYHTTFDGRIVIEHLADAILTVLKKWNKPNGDFDAMWHGYETLLDELRGIGHNVTLNQVKKEIRNLKKLDKIELKPTYDTDYVLSGRGWFIVDELPL